MVEESRDPTPAEMLLAMIAGKARTRTIAATRSVLARVPEHLLCYIDALAEMAERVVLRWWFTSWIWQFKRLPGQQPHRSGTLFKRLQWFTCKGFRRPQQTAKAGRFEPWPC